MIQDVRRGFFSKRKTVRHRVAACAVTCALSLGVLVGPGREIVGQVLRGESLSKILAGRSPGFRSEAGLIKVKGKDLALRRTPRQQRVLPLLRTRDPIFPVEDVDLSGSSFLPVTAPIDLPGGTFTDSPVNPVYPGGPIFPGPSGFPILPPGIPMPPPNTEPAIPQPTPPIPEPATWAMMVIGFGSIGAALRRARARKTDAHRSV
ncbi:PEPxxWA-CTERM sorting domain-containing protein [Sphingomonas guangdongensis]|uniref:PEPxxWA-CTERM sorting domain-containing protein n=1 Tax=Sphingomonas guangdongensis TaxID=1141890 RepID=UPI000BE36914|nr:PEPxxWA-CTERM sorting domain-containing protein [Sphingomonas guangdongensis]